jgi:DNA mismatch endonuclease (patch repair protein)
MKDLSRQERSELMARIRSKDTKPELLVRRLTHSLGYRFRLHRRDLPGTPDLVFPARRKVIFVHGCFWHDHRCRSGKPRVRSNVSYWEEKLARNVERDRKQIAALADAEWQTLVIWECECRPSGTPKLKMKISSFLGSARAPKAETASNSRAS